MMHVAQKVQTAYNKTAAQWSASRADMVSAVYQDGKIDSLVDTVESNYSGYTLPAGCAQLDRYTIVDPGGRSGGSVLYTFLLIPTAAANGKLLIWHWGHNDHATQAWWQLCPTDGSSVVVRALALGYHVLVCEMPGTGAQPDPQLVSVGGAAATQPSPLAHSYAPLAADGGPSPMRMFTDHVIRSLNQALLAFPTAHVYAAGHSGGGYTVALIGALEDRISRAAIIHGGIPRFLGPVTVPEAEDYEQWTANPIFQHCLNEFSGLVAVSAALPMKRSLVCHAELDTNFLTAATRSNRKAAELHWESIANVVATAGAELQFYWSSGDHYINVDEAESILVFFESP